MLKIALTDQSGVETLIDAEPGLSLMEIIPEAGFDELAALCGGSCSCATCHVYVGDPERLGFSSMSVDENDLL
jgi:2Fe-2S ferredoxin